MLSKTKTKGKDAATPSENSDFNFSKKIQYNPTIDNITSREVNNNIMKLISLIEANSSDSNFLENILDMYAPNNELIYLIFWICFESNREDLVDIVMTNSQVYFKNNRRINLKKLKTSDKLNNYAYEIALSYNLEENILLFILKKGKVVIDLDYIKSLLEENRISIVKSIFQAGNFCKIENNDLLIEYFEEIANISSETNPNKTNLNQSVFNTTTKTSNNTRNNSPFKTRNILNQSIQEKNKTSNLNKTKNLKEENPNSNSNKEIKDLVKYNKCRMSLFVLILLHSYKNPIKSNLLNLNTVEGIYANSARKINNEREYEKIEKEKPEVKQFLSGLRSILLFDVKKFYSYQLLDALYTANLSPITLEVLEADLIDVNIDVINLVLKNSDIEFFIRFLQKNIFSEDVSENNLLTNQSFSETVFDYCLIDPFNIEIYLFALKNCLDFLKINTAKKLINLIEDLSDLDSAKDNSIKYLVNNPLKILILMCEILQIISNKFPTLRVKSDRILEKGLTTTENLQNIIEEENVLREILIEKDLLGRSVLKIISDNNFLNLLTNSLVEKITDDQWNGLYQLADKESNFLQTSSNYRSLNVSLTTTDYDIFTTLRNTQKKTYFPNFSQFQVWKKHIFSKFVVEIIIILLITLHMQVNVILMLEDYKKLLNYKSSQNLFEAAILGKTFGLNYSAIITNPIFTTSEIKLTESQNNTLDSFINVYDINFNDYYKAINSSNATRYSDFSISDSTFSDSIDNYNRYLKILENEEIVNADLEPEELRFLQYTSENPSSSFNSTDSNLTNSTGIPKIAYISMLKYINPAQYELVVAAKDSFFLYYIIVRVQGFYLMSFEYFTYVFYLFIASYVVRFVFYLKVKKYILPLTKLCMIDFYYQRDTMEDKYKHTISNMTEC